MDHSILYSAGYLLYIFALFVGAGVLAWLATLILKSKQMQYSMVFAFLILFPAFIPNVMWDTWEIHLLLPLIYLLLVRIPQHERVSNLYLPLQLRYDNPALALGVFFIYAFVSSAWAYFPMESFVMILLQFISIAFAYLIFIRIQNIHPDIFANNGELSRLLLVVSIGSFVLLLLASDIVPKIYSVAISLFEENIKELSANRTLAKYLENLTMLLFQRTFFDSGFTLFAVLAFPLAMLMPNRNASLLLLGGIFLAIFLISNSEASKIGLLLGICVVLFLPKLPRWAQQIMPWVILIGITFIPFLSTLLLSTIPEFFNLAFVRESGFFINSLGPRLWIYENTLLLDIWAHPWFGHGIAIHFDKADSTSILPMFFAASAYQHTHNHVLTLLVELGVIGLFLFLWVCACILRAIQTLNEQYRPYAFGAFFSALCLTAFSQPLWGIGLVIWCVIFLVFAFFVPRTPTSLHQKTPAIGD